MPRSIFTCLLFILLAAAVWTQISERGDSPSVCAPIPLTIGQTVIGALESGDCIDANTALYDGYTFDGTAGEQVNILMGSEAFAADVRLVQGSYPGGTVLATGVTAGSGIRRIAAFMIPTSGTYTIVASSAAPGQSGTYSVTLEPTNPRVDLIQRTSPNPAMNNTNVGFLVNFSTGVTQVDAADFAVTANGLTGASVVSVSGGGAMYSVTVNTGTGDGTLRLDVIDNDTIIDSLNVPLGGVGPGNGNFTTGPSYAVNSGQTPTPSPTPTSNSAVVTSTNDDGPGSLRQAIAEVASGGSISFGPLFNTPQTITLTSGELRVVRSVTITGPGQNLLTVSGNNASRIFNLGGSSPLINITISGLAITNGRAPDDDFGGGIESNFVNLTVANSTIAGNVSPGGSFGGGGGIDSFEGALTVIGCTITGNTANRIGGAILSDLGPLTVSNSVITLNQTTHPQGNGGGISAGTGPLSISDTILQGNHVSAVGGFGGGIHVTGAPLTITASTLRANSAANGGGISVSAIPSVTILRSTIDTNSASLQGGGLFIRNTNASLTEVTISGNSAGGTGTATGALTLDATSGTRTVRLVNSTVAANTAAVNAGGGLVAIGRNSESANAVITLRNTIAANNTGPNLRTVVSNGAAATITSEGFNLTNDEGGGFLTQATDKVNAEAGLAPLGDNGGPTRTHALLSISSALDAGNSSGSATDQRGSGFARPIDLGFPNAQNGDGSDIGAFEAQTAPPPPVTVSGRVTTPTGLNLRNATVILTDPQGLRRTATTSSFGIFTFNGVQTGVEYIVSVSSKRYRFAPRTVVVTSAVSGLDFAGLE